MKIYVFSLLFALAVDKTDYEERLSMICDLAVILEVTEDEIYDMTQVVRFLYRDIKKADVQFRTETCENLFSYLLK